jgi:SHS2 domain-containing protein
MSIRYQFLDHPADIKIRSFGKDLPELFANSALGMTAYLYGEKDIALTNEESIVVEAENLESLLVNWLAEILYLSAVNKRAYLKYNIQELTRTKISAKISSGKTIAKDEIKAVTYHELTITETKNGWEATVVYDI